MEDHSQCVSQSSYPGTSAPSTTTHGRPPPPQQEDSGASLFDLSLQTLASSLALTAAINLSLCQSTFSSLTPDGSQELLSQNCLQASKSAMTGDVEHFEELTSPTHLHALCPPAAISPTARGHVPGAATAIKLAVLRASSFSRAQSTALPMDITTLPTAERLARFDPDPSGKSIFAHTAHPAKQTTMSPVQPTAKVTAHTYMQASDPGSFPAPKGTVTAPVFRLNQKKPPAPNTGYMSADQGMLGEDSSRVRCILPYTIAEPEYDSDSTDESGLHSSTDPYPAQPIFQPATTVVVR